METALANLAELAREGEKDLLKSPTAFDIAAEILREDMKERARRALDGEPILETGVLEKAERISAILRTNQSPRECTERIEQLMREAGKTVKQIEPQIRQFGKALRTGGSRDESDQAKSGEMKSADELRYEIHVIGPPGMVRGILAVPLTDRIVLDLPALQDVATTQEGPGLFPIECAVEGCELVIDDDGRVFAHIEQSGQENAIRNQLDILLQRLYVGESR